MGPTVDCRGLLLLLLLLLLLQAACAAEQRLGQQALRGGGVIAGSQGWEVPLRGAIGSDQAGLRGGGGPEARTALSLLARMLNTLLLCHVLLPLCRIVLFVVLLLLESPPEHLLPRAGARMLGGARCSRRRSVLRAPRQLLRAWLPKKHSLVPLSLLKCEKRRRCRSYPIPTVSRGLGSHSRRESSDTHSGCGRVVGGCRHLQEPCADVAVKVEGLEESTISLLHRLHPGEAHSRGREATGRVDGEGGREAAAGKATGWTECAARGTVHELTSRVSRVRS